MTTSGTGATPAPTTTATPVTSSALANFWNSLLDAAQTPLANGGLQPGRTGNVLNSQTASANAPASSGSSMADWAYMIVGGILIALGLWATFKGNNTIVVQAPTVSSTA